MSKPQHRESTAEMLKRLDNEPFSWYHLKTIVICGMGFFTDSYDLFVINLLMPMIGYAYFGWNKNKVTEPINTIIKGAAVIGTFFGQVAFGYLGDRVGRKKIYGIELMIIIAATVGCILAANMVRGLQMVVLLAFWRFVLGVGIGGDYPLSAVFASEFASSKRRGMIIAAVFSMQGIGILAAAIVSIIVIACFKHPLIEDPHNADYCWRIIAGFAIAPASFALFYRLTFPETPRYTLFVEGQVEKAARDISSVLENNGDLASTDIQLTTLPHKAVVQSDGTIAVHVEHQSKKASTWTEFRKFCSTWKNFKILLGTCLSWFFLDVAYYGLSLNNSQILAWIGYAKGANAYETLHKVALGNLIINLAGYVPGYYFTVAFIERMGRKSIQLMGFVMLTIILSVLAGLNGKYGVEQPKWFQVVFIVLYCLGLFFMNFGANTTTFIIPSEVFPTRVRSTCHGLSAGAGKIGAIVANYIIVPYIQGNVYPGTHPINGMSPAESLTGILAAFAIVMALGIPSTLLVPETTGRSLEEINEEFEGELLGQLPQRRELGLSQSQNPLMASSQTAVSN